MSQSVSAVIFGCEGQVLTQDEHAFFKELNPMGYILFARNCDNPQQLRALTDSLRELSGDAKLPILIDQEGGRVARLRPPHWRATPTAASLSACARDDMERAKRLIYLNTRLMASELHTAGITVNCAPLADVPVPECHDIIGDRAFGDTPQQVAELARVQSDALLDGGVLPVLKHIPGHGRALADSHLELPTVTVSREMLEATDFVPFKLLNDLPFGMTAHIRYTAIDADQPATLSPTAIHLIREELCFDGVLMSDDVSMKALKGDLTTISKGVLDAGCDVVLHCNGKMDEMQAVAKGVRAMNMRGLHRLYAAKAMLKPAKTDDVQAMLAEFDALSRETMSA